MKARGVRSDLRIGLPVISEGPTQGRHEASDEGVPEPDGGRVRDAESVRRYAADGIAKASLEQLGEVASTRVRGHRTDALVVREGEVPEGYVHTYNYTRDVSTKQEDDGNTID